MLPWRCIEAVSATTQLLILCMSMWAASGAGSLVCELRIGIPLGQRRRQFGVVSVNVIGEVNFAVLIGECRPIDNKDRHSLHQVYGDVIFSAQHSLLHS